MENVGCLLHAKRECACSVNGTAGGAVCHVSGDIACIMCVCVGGGPWFHAWNSRWWCSFRIAMT